MESKNVAQQLPQQMPMEQILARHGRLSLQYDQALETNQAADRFITALKQQLEAANAELEKQKALNASQSTMICELQEKLAQYGHPQEGIRVAEGKPAQEN